MEEKVIATKSNFTIITKVVTIVSLVIFILYPTSNEIYKILNYVAIVAIVITLILFIMQILNPKNLITKKGDKIYLNKIHKRVAIELGAISSINIKHKSNRGFKYQFGTIYIYTKINKVFKVANINNVDEVKRTLTNMINK
ncbi:MAG TPA: hypothetical protein GXZ48_02735 [Acholeplasmataceae bacterium]|nr:hypothetical protein [Acholeplasmataceae bacterium]